MEPFCSIHKKIMKINYAEIYARSNCIINFPTLLNPVKITLTTSNHYVCRRSETPTRRPCLNNILALYDVPINYAAYSKQCHNS